MEKRDLNGTLIGYAPHPLNTFSACIAQEAMLQRNEQQRHPSIWKGLRNRIYLGGEDFVARMQARLRATESLDEIPKVQRHPVPQSLQAFAEAYGYGSGVCIQRLHAESDRGVLRRSLQHGQSGGLPC
jgi:hypothetical protein